MTADLQRPPGTAPAHVAFVLNSLCVGGAEKQVVSLLNRLAHPGLEASLLCLKHDDALRPQLDPGRVPRGIWGLGVTRGLEWGGVRRLARHIDAQAVDVLLCTNLYALAYGALARAISRRRGRVKLVEVFHTTLPGSRRPTRCSPTPCSWRRTSLSTTATSFRWAKTRSSILR